MESSFYNSSDNENLHQNTISIDPVVISHGPVIKKHKRKHNEAFIESDGDSDNDENFCSVLEKFSKIIENPGLHHITRKILLYLNSQSLLVFKEMSLTCKKIYKKPSFLLEKWTVQGLSTKHHSDWKNVIQITKNTRLERYVQSYIEKVIEIGHIVDIPCYIDRKTVATFTDLYTFDRALRQKDLGMIQVLALSVENCTQYPIYGRISLTWAIMHENIAIIKILAPLSSTPNALCE